MNTEQNKVIKLSDLIGQIIIASLTIIFVIIALIVVNKLDKENQQLREAVAEYQTSEDWFDDYLDIIGELYEQGIDNAVLEERIKWLERTEVINPQQMYDDFDILFEEFDSYTGTDFHTYFENKRPEVYARIEQYDELFG